jgi:hypothetical protein
MASLKIISTNLCSLSFSHLPIHSQNIIVFVATNTTSSCALVWVFWLDSNWNTEHQKSLDENSSTNLWKKKKFFYTEIDFFFVFISLQKWFQENSNTKQKYGLVESCLILIGKVDGTLRLFFIARQDFRDSIEVLFRYLGFSNWNLVSWWALILWWFLSEFSTRDTDFRNKFGKLVGS